MAAPEADLQDHKFSLREILGSFSQCLSEKKEVYLEHYVCGWRGLVK